MKRVLIVEDELVQLTLITSLVEKAGYAVEHVGDGDAAVERILGAGAPLDIVLLDNGLPGRSGIEVLEAIKPKRPELPVVMLTAQTSHKVVIDAMRAGASDFIVKPASAERIRTALVSVQDQVNLVGETGALRADEETGDMSSLIGSSPAIESAKALGLKAARSLIPVLIEGESGVGKEVFAKAIHTASTRAGSPFVAVNCGAIPANLVESTLFGHIKGAFTGATETRKGKFEEASGGTLFLDEVGELPIDVQPKLLRALQERMIDPVGAAKSVPVDIRVISATNRTLEDQVAAGSFREDLFYRLNVFPVRLPALRDRASDIPALAEHFADRVAASEKLARPDLTSELLTALQAYPWPGNVRQLQNAMFRAMVLAEDKAIALEDFGITAGTARQTTDNSPAHMPVSAGVDAASLALTHGEHVRSLADIEAEVIARAIDHYRGRMSEVARRLGIGRSTLYRKLKDYGLEEKA